MDRALVADLYCFTALADMLNLKSFETSLSVIINLLRPNKINCMFLLIRPTLFYAADPKLFSAPKLHFTPVDKYFFAHVALSHLNVTNDHKKKNYQGWLKCNKHKGK